MVTVYGKGFDFGSTLNTSAHATSGLFRYLGR